MAAYSKRRRLGAARAGRGRRVRGKSRVMKGRTGRRRLTGTVDTPVYAPGSNPFAGGQFDAGQWSAFTGQKRSSGMDGVRQRGARRGAPRRRFAGSRTVVTSTKELQRVRQRFGPGKAYKTGQLLKMTVPWRILRFQGMNVDDKVDGTNDTTTTLPGYFPMRNYLGNSLLSFGQAPLYVFALNDTIQNSTLDVGQFYKLTLESTGRSLWTNADGLDNAALTRGNWQVERDETGGGQGATCKWVVNNWYDVRLKMYGCKNQQTSYYVEYVQCTKDYAAIEDEPMLNTSTSVLAEKYRDDVYGYWQDRVKTLVSNTLSTVYNPRRSKDQPYKVIKSWRYDIKPEDSGDVDSTPNAIEARLMIKDGRMCDYQWLCSTNAYDAARTGGTTGADDFIVDPNRYNPASDDQYVGVTYRPAPRGRRYLVIRAITTKETTVAGTAQDTPSFDMLIRKHEQLGRSRTAPA